MKNPRFISSPHPFASMDDIRIALMVLALLAGHCSATGPDVTSCIDSQDHKRSPGPESSLYGQCTPWKDESCCTENTSYKVHEQTNEYSFTLDFCQEQTGRPMSETCKRHFRKDFCFYECEPNIGPWIRKTNRKFSKERFFEVPLCESHCKAWWRDCRFEHVCTPNWPQGFKLIDGRNYCPKGSACVHLHLMYKNASEFCSQVWDYAWKVVPDDRPCIKLWFDGSKGNSNKAVAQYYASQSDSQGGLNRAVKSRLSAPAALTFAVFAVLLTVPW